MDRQSGNPWADLEGRVVMAPSLLACDFARVGEQIDEVVSAGAEVLHVDIMDGHFVPNLSMGPGFVRKIRPHAARPLDVHLMVTDPGYYVERFAEAGADSITFHIEATDEPAALIDRLGQLGLGAGITLRPNTPAKALDAVLDAIDLVLVMTVEPGYGGQSFMDDQLEKIHALRSRLRPGQRLEVDGGINPRTGARAAEAGADTFVAGENIFGAKDMSGAVSALRDATSAVRN